MRFLIGSIIFALLFSNHTNAQTNQNALEKKSEVNSQLDQRFSQLALSCIHKEFPNIIKHMMVNSEQVKTPKALYPAFYGCFDWHSSVHGHWLLVRLLRTNTDLTNRKEIIEKLSQSFTPENIKGELEYFNRANTGTSFERPYGLAWFLQLTSELRQWDHPISAKWLKILIPLENKIVANLSSWLPKLAYPIRVGEHSQTAFAFGLILDWSQIAQNKTMQNKLSKKINAFYFKDVNCPLNYEPSGQDFLSPCLAEADLMRRIMPATKYALWLDKFLPNIPTKKNEQWLSPVVVSDASDGKLAHLDGLNLSRAWMLQGIAKGLPEDDPRRLNILATAQSHQQAGINAIVNDLHYMGSHWLGSFATYLVTQRGISIN